GLSWKGVNVKGDAVGLSYIDNLGTFFLAPLFAAYKHSKGKAEEKPILHDMEGVMKAGELVLVLGRPGSGCSTFLRTMGNLVRNYTAVTGTRLINGVDMDTFVKADKGLVNYNEENDIHYPTLTVRQTLQYTLKCRMPGSALKEKRERALAVILSLLGLNRCADTPVGDAMLRGISGGEKKRLSIAETLCCGGIVNLWDGSTRGLDASSSLEYVKALKIACLAFKTINVCSFYQVSEAIYDLYDRVIVLSCGRMIYSGPANRAKAYFEDLGFVCPPRKTTADFLTGITEYGERIVRRGFEDRVPMTPQGFADAFRASEQFQRNRAEQAELDAQMAEEQQQEAFREAKAIRDQTHNITAQHSPYSATYGQQCRAALKREFQLQSGNPGKIIFQSIFSILIALCIGIVFLQQNQNTLDAFNYGGILFFLLLSNVLSAQAEIPGLFEGREVLLKQKRLGLAKPSAQYLASILGDLPSKTFVITLFTIIVYFLSDLSNGSPGGFFILWFAIMVTSQSYLGFVKLLSVVLPDVDVANVLNSISLLLLISTTGFLLTLQQLPGWYVWIYWINPIAYGFRAIYANQFNGLRLECIEPQLIPSGPAYANVPLANRACASFGGGPGVTSIAGADYLYAQLGYRPSDIWWCIGAVIGFTVLFLTVAVLLVDRIEFGKGGFATRAYKLPAGHVARQLRRTGFLRLRRWRHSESHAARKTGLGTRALPMTWKHIDYSVQDGKLQLLSDIEGYAVPGKMVALVGASGAGKSTLLDCISRRKTTGKIDGDIMIGAQPQRSDFKRTSGYCEQLDVHPPLLTVREVLRFSAEMRQEATVSKAEKYAFVETVLEILEMQDIAEAVVGSLETGIGISVEERKRLTIGVELVARPSILFLDEPTSGLDSQSSFAIIRLIRKLADSGQSILCTIHQPSAVLFEHFDMLCVLVNTGDGRGGRVAYFGDLGPRSKTMIDYFERNGATPIDPDANPAEWTLDVIGAGMGRGSSTDWGRVWAESPERQAIQRDIETIVADAGASAARPDGTTTTNTTERPRDFSLPFRRQLPLMLKRDMLSYYRNTSYTLGRLLLFTVTGFLFGTMYLNTNQSVGDIQIKVYALFFAITMAILLVNLGQPVFFQRRALFYRESTSGFYSWVTFAMSTVLVEIPYTLICVVPFFLLLYYPVRLNPATSHAGFFFITLCVYFLSSVFLGIMIAALAPNLIVATIINPLIMSLLNLCNGVLVRGPSIVWPFRIVWYANPLSQAVQAIIPREFGGQEVYCETAKLVPVQPPTGQSCDAYFQPFFSSGGAGYVETLSDGNCGYCQYRTGDEYLKQFGWNSGNTWSRFGYLWVFTVFSAMMIFVFVWMRGTGKR
ncbi:hypothetical protein CXG81DRAFT_1071, partial [Caulochytrium protostelioides]